MLLKQLYEFANANKLLDDLAFAEKPIKWIIPLDKNGKLVGQGLISTQGEGKRGKTFSAPRTSRDKGVGGVAEFLADGLTALFGVESDPNKQYSPKTLEERNRNNAQKHQHFWAQIREAYEKTKHPGLLALLLFHEQLKGLPPFLRLDDTGQAKRKWLVKTASGTEEPLGPDLFTFQVDGKLLLLDETAIRPFWRQVYARELEEKNAQATRGICLVTGRKNVPIATTHLPKIKGVPNTQSFGAAVVSFDKDSFTSYGFEQSHNAPVCIEAVLAYCTALNELIKREEHSLAIGDTVLCFWTGKSSEASNFFAQMLKKPDPRAVAEFLNAPWAGVDRNLARQDYFYSVTLSGNGGRVVVRHWMQQTLEQARENFRRWFEDLRMVELPRHSDAARKKRRKSEQEDNQSDRQTQMPPLAIFRLACATVREAKDLQADVPTQLYRAALEGTAPSLSMVKPILAEFQKALASDAPKTPRYPFNISRFALLRLILNRNRKEEAPMIEPKVFQTDDPAYNCGRLLAILAETQAKAHEYALEGPGVAERYFGAACISPSSVFPLLLRLNRHHLDKISKSSKYGGHERFLEAEISLIAAQFKPASPGGAPEFPRYLDLHEQGRFAIGFYQQKAEIEMRKRQGGSAGAGPAA